MSVTAFATQLNDDTGTWIKTSRFESTFSWDHDKFTKTLVHPASKLPLMNMNDSFSIFTSFCQLPEKTGLVPNNSPSVFLSCSSPSSDPASPQLTDGEQHIYDIGQKLTLVRDGHGEDVIFEAVDVDFDTMVPYYTVKLSNDITTSVTK